MARVPHFPPARRTLLLAALAGAATLPVPAADAMAARYVAKPAGGGRIALDVVSGQLRRIRAALPSRCENDHGGSWSARLAIDESGTVALQSGRFGFQGRARDNVRFQVDGRLRNGAISGRIRLTYLDIDHVGVGDDTSFLCDTGTTSYRAVRRR